MVNITNKDIWYVLGLSAIFVLGNLITSLVYIFLIRPIQQRRMMEQRLSEDRRRDENLHAMVFKSGQGAPRSMVITLLKRVGYQERLERLQRSLLQADIHQNVGSFLSLVGIIASGSFIVADFMGQWLLGVFLAVASGAVPFLLISLKKKRKGLLIESQMPDVMELLARSLRAGHTLPSAMELAGKEAPPPLGTELRLTYEEQRLGIGINEALRHMVERVDSRDLRYFVTAVLIQSETGGNLAEIMEKIGYLIRERLRVKGKIKGLTAEGRFSAYILGGLPFAMFMILYFVHRNYVMILFDDPWGQKLLVGALISMALGSLSMRKLIHQIKL